MPKLATVELHSCILLLSFHSACYLSNSGGFHAIKATKGRSLGGVYIYMYIHIYYIYIYIVFFGGGSSISWLLLGSPFDEDRRVLESVLGPLFLEASYGDYTGSLL